MLYITYDSEKSIVVKKIPANQKWRLNMSGYIVIKATAGVMRIFPSNFPHRMQPEVGGLSLSEYNK